jgi:diacylglycerol kinase family enzyme
MSGIGFDAHVAHCFADYGKRGFSSYVMIVLREYAKFKPYKVQLEANGEVLNPSIFMLTFANSSQFGNDALISPQSDMRDGKFEVCILKRLDKTSIPAFGYKLMTGKLKSNNDFKIISTKEARISNYAEKILHIDGEAISVESDFTVKVNPLSLRIVVPV